MLALRVYETKLTSKNPFIVNLFALGSEKGCKYGLIHQLSFGTPREVVTCLSTLIFQTTSVVVFPHYFSFDHFLAFFCGFLNKKTEFTQFDIKCLVKQASALPSQCASLLETSSAKSPSFFQNF